MLKGKPQSIPRCSHGNYRSQCQQCSSEHRTVIGQTEHILNESLARIYENDEGIKSTMKHALTRAYYLGQQSVIQE